MKKIWLVYITLILFASNSMAKEGMWLPFLIENELIHDMQSMGCKLSAEQIYSVNNACIKDAVLRFGGGCTATIISESGLMVTNYHCSHGLIQALSTLDDNYLETGFWANNMGEEKPISSLSVTRLVRMEDVTEEINDAIDTAVVLSKAEVLKIAKVRIINKATENNHYHASVESVFYDNQTILIVSEKFNDVRLVGAPPMTIGKFGGETDNWMWPRHTIDFSLFRVYANAQNKPANYNKENLPYKSIYHLPMSSDGVKEDDFTLVCGFPGYTYEYKTSHSLKSISQVVNPTRVRLSEVRLDILRKYMDQNPELKLKHSANYARISNSWKKWKGQQYGFERLQTIEKKLDFEDAFIEWASRDSLTKANFYDLMNNFEICQLDLNVHLQFFEYMYAGFFTIDLLNNTSDFSGLDKVSSDNVGAKKEQLFDLVLRSSEICNNELDKDIFKAILNDFIEYFPEEYKYKVFDGIDAKFIEDTDGFVEYLYGKSIFNNQFMLLRLIKKFNYKLIRKVENDPAYCFYQNVFRIYNEDIKTRYRQILVQKSKLNKLYIRSLMQLYPDSVFYPDANSTYRLAYGKVESYTSSEGVAQKYYTTLGGLVAKEDSSNIDYTVDPKLKQLCKSGEYEDVPLSFIASNHTSGGNSGSPVINANGELIGVNFDRNWEGTISDYDYDSSICRNICLDVRMIVFMIDKYANAQWLLKEMNLK